MLKKKGDGKVVSCGTRKLAGITSNCLRGPRVIQSETLERDSEAN
jgi:hypothetical protein